MPNATTASCTGKTRYDVALMMRNTGGQVWTMTKRRRKRRNALFGGEGGRQGWCSGRRKTSHVDNNVVVFALVSDTEEEERVQDLVGKEHYQDLVGKEHYHSCYIDGEKLWSEITNEAFRLAVGIIKRSFVSFLVLIIIRTVSFS